MRSVVLPLRHPGFDQRYVEQLLQVQGQPGVQNGQLAQNLVALVEIFADLAPRLEAEHRGQQQEEEEVAACDDREGGGERHAGQKEDEHCKRGEEC